MSSQKKLGTELPKKNRLGPVGRMGIVVAVVAVFFLIARSFETSESKAERKYQSALSLVAQGDNQRAKLELRNTIKIENNHRNARFLLAEIAEGEGKFPEAYKEYLTLTEMYPNDIEIRGRLIGIALEHNASPKIELFDEIARHGNAVIEINQSHPLSKQMKLIVEYNSLYERRKFDLINKLRPEFEALLEENPQATFARRVYVDILNQQQETKKALENIDLLIGEDPDSLSHNIARLKALRELGKDQEALEQLLIMYEKYPENVGVRESIITWYIENDALDEAENFLRELAGDPLGDTPGHIELISFQRFYRGTEVSLKELDFLISQNQENQENQENALTYRALKASIKYDDGLEEEAISDLEDIISFSEQDTNAIRNARFLYARYVGERGQVDDAKKQVDLIIEGDPGHVGALNLRAVWKLEENDTGGALLDLSTSLDQDSRNSRTLVLMARAHLQEGATELARERLANAYEASGRNTETAVLYSDFLLLSGDALSAQKVLDGARKDQPEDLLLVDRLATILRVQEDWANLKGLVEELEILGTEVAIKMADSISSTVEANIGNLSGLYNKLLFQIENGAEISSVVIKAFVFNSLSEEEVRNAREIIIKLIEKNPSNIEYRLYNVYLTDKLRVFLGAGETLPETGEALKKVVAENPDNPLSARTYYSFLKGQGRNSEATDLLDKYIEIEPDSQSMNFIKANELEQEGKIDEALAIYMVLYEKDNSNVIVLNNILHLLSVHKNDAESIDFIFDTYHRLRNLESPSIQDTYGWIEYRIGNFRHALDYLELAASSESSRDNIVVQFHYGMALASLGNSFEAKSQLEKTILLAGKTSSPEIEIAKNVVKAIESSAVNTPIVPMELLFPGDLIDAEKLSSIKE